MKLDNPVSQLPLVGPAYVNRLGKLGISTVEDLIHHVPSRYADFRKIVNIADAKEGETVTIKGIVTSAKNIYTRSRKKIQYATIKDQSGEIEAVWFNQPYLVKSIGVGDKFAFSGKVDIFNRKKSLVSPEYENIDKKDETIHTARLVPVYPSTAGVSSKWLRGRINFAINAVDTWLDEFLPTSVLKELDFIPFADAVKEIHFPETLNDAKNARDRLSFNEFLFLQITNLYRKENWSKNQPANPLKITAKLYKDFTRSLPFSLTKSQDTSINEILNDLGADTPMNRLLEGDVGSGKTVVAAAAAFAAFANGHQSVFMAPTQILAHQHFYTLKSIFDQFKVRVGLITSSGVRADLGKTDTFVGTHALIHKKVNFDNVALVVIDEQHRFGVKQRAHLIKKSGKRKKVPHVLTMTATPIPRTIALTCYGDLDLSTLDELPAGRLPITTWLVPPQKRKGAYNWIAEQIKKEKIQVFIVCPLIEESTKETMQQVKAATQEYENLKTVFGKLNLGLLHGKLKAKEKDKVIDDFKSGRIDILITTPVVEVGIDIPNATIMLIEGADRFGLAQLHQLRGRIGRGKKKSYCLLFTQSQGAKVRTRLNALKKTLSGFELAELDLKLRGPGEVFGTKQHGFPELKIASWQDVKLNKLAKEVAVSAMKNKKKFSKLFKKLERREIVFN